MSLKVRDRLQKWLEMAGHEGRATRGVWDLPIRHIPQPQERLDRMQHYHAVVWLDHTQARIFFFDRHSVEEIDIATRTADHHLHHKKGSIAGKRQPEDQHFMHEIVEALKPAKEWLIMGPGAAKLELVKHVHNHDKQLSDHIVGVETSDHPTDKQIVAHAREYFKAADAMR